MTPVENKMMQLNAKTVPLNVKMAILSAKMVPFNAKIVKCQNDTLTPIRHNKCRQGIEANMVLSSTKITSATAKCQNGIVVPR